MGAQLSLQADLVLGLPLKYFIFASWQRLGWAGITVQSRPRVDALPSNRAHQPALANKTRLFAAEGFQLLLGLKMLSLP